MRVKVWNKEYEITDCPCGSKFRHNLSKVEPGTMHYIFCPGCLRMVMDWSSKECVKKWNGMIEKGGYKKKWWE